MPKYCETLKISPTLPHLQQKNSTPTPKISDVNPIKNKPSRLYLDISPYIEELVIYYMCVNLLENAQSNAIHQINHYPVDKCWQNK